MLVPVIRPFQHRGDCAVEIGEQEMPDGEF